MADPEFLAHYCIERREDGSLFELGRGAMGTTYKAFDTKLHCPVALKVINTQILNNETVRQRFLREARSAAGLRHKNVASVFHLGDEGDTYFYAMEFIDGETIEALVRRAGRVEPSPALNITLQVVSALMAAHRRNLIHRDIKPANLMLVREDEDELLVKVIDFGLAKSIENLPGATLTLGGFVGTPYFASPEQLEEKTLDARSDIYSLGATLWYMLTGKPMFTGSLLQVMSQHLNKQPPYEQLSETAIVLRPILERMLAKDPDNRPQTPLLLRQELVACRQSFSPEIASVSSTVFTSKTAMLLANELRPGQGVSTDRGTAGPAPSSQGVGTDGGTSGPVLPGTDNQLPLTGAVVGARYRLDKYCGGSPMEPFFQAHDLYINQDVGLKVLPPSAIGIQRWVALEETVKTIQSSPHPNLKRVLSLQRFTEYGALVSEWVSGYSLIEMLSVRSSFNLTEAALIFDQLVLVTDHAASHQLEYVDLSIRRVFLQLPGGESADARALLSQTLDKWPAVVVKAHPLQLELLMESETMGAAQDRTIMADLLSAAKAAGSDVLGRDHIFALAYLLYELLGGRGFSTHGSGASGRRGPSKITVLTEEQNDLLRSVLVSGNDRRFNDGRAFYDAFFGTTILPRGSVQSGLTGATLSPVPPGSATAGTSSNAATANPIPVEPAPALPETRADLPADRTTARPHGALTETGRTSMDDWVRWLLVAGCIAMASVGGWLWLHGPVPEQKKPAVPAVVPVPPPGTSPADSQAGTVPPNAEQQLMLALRPGQDLENAGKYADAIKVYVDAARRFPDYDEPKKRLNKVCADIDQMASDSTFRQLRGAITDAANAGSTSAMMVLGGRLMVSDQAEALKWFKMAANDRRDAMTLVGKMYFNGTGSKTGPDFAQAASWLGKAAESGDAEAKFFLGELYLNGRGVNRDEGKAVELFKESAGFRFALAENALGELYRDGVGVPTSAKQAVEYFEDARKHGSADASGSLGAMYINGLGVERNPAYGLDLIRKGVEGNSPVATYIYSRCLEKGITGKPNLEQAKIYYVKAARLGFPDAIEWCDKNGVSH